MQNLRRKNESGRSMVEMLGVLSIIGVLSVGGISAYSTAMEKHKANELLQQASMLATTISAQVMTNDGNLPSTVTSFGNSSYGTFSTSVTNALDGKGFSITIENVDSGACTQLEKMAGGMVRQATCNGTTATISYYKNLATDPAEGEKSPVGVKPECSPACAEGQECIGGVCAKVTPKGTDGCSNNSDCDDWCEANGDGEKCYCEINADYLGNDSVCWKNFTGICAKATTKSGISSEYIASSSVITWWSAVNFCKAHEKSMVSLADLGITDGYKDDGWCEKSDCTGSFTWSDLKSKVGASYYWMADALSCDLKSGECEAGTNNNSCRACFINSSYYAVYNFYRHNLNIYDYIAYALCQ